MKNSVFLPSIVLLAVFIYLPSQGTSEKPISETSISEYQTQVIRFSDSGIDPKEVRIKREERVLFLSSETTSSSATVEIDFHEHATSCSSLHMKSGENGKIRSEPPLGPNDFASTCFHDTGTYDFTIYGLANDPAGTHGKIIVE